MELAGVIVAVCAVVKPEAKDGEMLPELLTDQVQSNGTMLSIGVNVIVNGFP